MAEGDAGGKATVAPPREQTTFTGAFDFDGAIIGDLTVEQCRAAVAYKAGTVPRRATPLRKQTLHSAYAYLTGEWLYPRTANDPSDPRHKSRKELLVAVVAEAGALDPADLADAAAKDLTPAEVDAHEAEGESYTVGTIDRWAGSVSDLPGALRKVELQKLLTEMVTRGDQRDWSTKETWNERSVGGV